MKWLYQQKFGWCVGRWAIGKRSSKIWWVGVRSFNLSKGHMSGILSCVPKIHCRVVTDGLEGKVKKDENPFLFKLKITSAPL